MNAPHAAAQTGGDALLASLSVVVVTYNSAHCIPALANALRELPYVFIVDNASSDNTLAEVARLLPQARTVRHARNLGFGAANNAALRQVATPFALLLNPDCIATPDHVRALMAVAMEQPEAAVIAPQLTDASGAASVNYRWPHTLWDSRGPKAEGLCCVGFVCGAVMLLRVEPFQGTGYFDEHFFLYYEDDDLCLRLFQARKPLLVAPQVRIEHRSRGSSRGAAVLRGEYLRGFHHAQSKVKFSAKHLSLRTARAQRAQVLALALLSLPFRLLLPVPRYVARLLGRIMGLVRVQI